MDYYWFAFLDTASFFNEWCNYIGETLDWGCLFNVANEQLYTVHNLTGLPHSFLKNHGILVAALLVAYTLVWRGFEVLGDWI